VWVPDAVLGVPGRLEGVGAAGGQVAGIEQQFQPRRSVEHLLRVLPRLNHRAEVGVVEGFHVVLLTQGDSVSEGRGRGGKVRIRGVLAAEVALPAGGSLAGAVAQGDVPLQLHLGGGGAHVDEVQAALRGEHRHLHQFLRRLRAEALGPVVTGLGDIVEHPFGFGLLTVLELNQVTGYLERGHGTFLLRGFRVSLLARLVPSLVCGSLPGTATRGDPEEDRPAEDGGKNGAGLGQTGQADDELSG